MEWLYFWEQTTFGAFSFRRKKIWKKHTQGKVVHQDLRLGLFPQVLLVVIRKRRPFLRGGANLNSISHLFWSHWLKLPNKAPETPTRPTEAAFPFFRGVLGLILKILGNPAMIFWWNACTHGIIAFLLEEASSAHLCETSILVAFLRVVLTSLCCVRFVSSIRPSPASRKRSLVASFPEWMSPMESQSQGSQNHESLAFKWPSIYEKYTNLGMLPTNIISDYSWWLSFNPFEKYYSRQIGKTFPQASGWKNNHTYLKLETSA